jgi:hypothetical protein
LSAEVLYFAAEKAILGFFENNSGNNAEIALFSVPPEKRTVLNIYL